MLLYICEACGRWCDASLAEALGRAFNAFGASFSGKEEATPLSYPCPDGHGNMALITAEQRLFAYSAESGARPALIRPFGANGLTQGKP